MRVRVVGNVMLYAEVEQNAPYYFRLIKLVYPYLTGVNRVVSIIDKLIDSLIIGFFSEFSDRHLGFSF
jgi:hypothetical protein